ncbi:hypothetical protein CWI39_2942p0010, partial [Hamiltosporidium magnivora]
IRKRDIDILKNNKNLKTLRISCEIIDYDTISSIKKNDFSNTMIIFENPVRAKRSVEINNYLDSEKKNISSETLKNNKIKAANDADQVNKGESGIQKCELHPLENSLSYSSHTTTTHPPQSQTCSNMQNSGLDTLRSPNKPLPCSVEVSRASHRTK